MLTFKCSADYISLVSETLKVRARDSEGRVKIGPDGKPLREDWVKRVLRVCIGEPAITYDASVPDTFVLPPDLKKYDPVEIEITAFGSFKGRTFLQVQSLVPLRSSPLPKK